LIRILLDQGLPRSAAESLKNVGWAVRHVAECALIGAAQIQDAIRNGAVVTVTDRAIRLRLLPIQPRVSERE
jgi:hypothetical protein